MEEGEKGLPKLIAQRRRQRPKLLVSPRAVLVAIGRQRRPAWIQSKRQRRNLHLKADIEFPEVMESGCQSKQWHQHRGVHTGQHNHPFAQDRVFLKEHLCNGRHVEEVENSGMVAAA
jgi:hypothetical protein